MRRHAEGIRDCKKNVIRKSVNASRLVGWEDGGGSGGSDGGGVVGGHRVRQLQGVVPLMVNDFKKPSQLGSMGMDHLFSILLGNCDIVTVNNPKPCPSENDLDQNNITFCIFVMLFNTDFMVVLSDCYATDYRFPRSI